MNESAIGKIWEKIFNILILILKKYQITKFKLYYNCDQIGHITISILNELTIIKIV